MHLVATLLWLVGLLSLCSNAERFVRFISTDGKEYYGDAILPANTTDAFFSTSAHVITGDILGDFTVTKEVKVSAEILAVNTGSLYNVVISQSRNFLPRFPQRESGPSAALA